VTRSSCAGFNEFHDWIPVVERKIRSAGEVSVPSGGGKSKPTALLRHDPSRLDRHLAQAVSHDSSNQLEGIQSWERERPALWLPINRQRPVHCRFA